MLTSGQHFSYVAITSVGVPVIFTLAERRISANPLDLIRFVPA